MGNKIAKQLLSGQTCSNCKYMDYCYPMGDKQQKIYMCGNSIRIKSIFGSVEPFINLDKRGTCENWIKNE